MTTYRIHPHQCDHPVYWIMNQDCDEVAHTTSRDVADAYVAEAATQHIWLTIEETCVCEDID